MSYDLAKHDFSNPDPWVALDLDRSTFFEPKAKDALLRGNASRSRQFLLPVLRPVARLSIVIVQLLRIVIPNRMTSPRTLHTLIVWGMKNFLSPEANYLILRHFHIGSQMLKFLGDNAGGVPLQSHPLKPRVIEDLGNNTFVQHDLNIYNFIIQVNALGGKFQPLPLERIDFSAIEDVDSQLPEMPATWHNFLDLQALLSFTRRCLACFCRIKTSGVPAIPYSSMKPSRFMSRACSTAKASSPLSTTGIPAYRFRHLKRVFV